MSRSDRALEAAVEALKDYAIDAQWEGPARACVTAYLDSLLERLPLEAERAAHDSMDVVDGRNWAGATRTEMLDAILPAFLLSLRSSSRGANR